MAVKLRREPKPLWRTALGVGCVALLFLFWFLATRGAAEERWIPPGTLPSPEETFGSFSSLWFERELTRNAVLSIWRVLQGFGLAALIGVPLGIMAGAFPPVRAFLAPISTFGRNVPISALVPLTMVWFGTDETQKVMFIFIATVMFVMFDAARAVTAVHDRYVQTALTLGASQKQVLFKVLVPLAMPSIFHSLRLLFGVGFGYIVLAEMVNMSGGLGALIMISQRLGPREHVYLVLIVITLMAWGIDKLLRVVEGLLFPHQEAT